MYRWSALYQLFLGVTLCTCNPKVRGIVEAQIGFPWIFDDLGRASLLDNNLGEIPFISCFEPNMLENQMARQSIY